MIENSIYHINPPEFRICERLEVGNNVQYDLEPLEMPGACPECGSVSFIKHGTTSRKVRDLSEFGKLVGIVIHGHRYLCKDCGNSWTDSFQSIDVRAKMTNRMRDYIRENALQRPFLHISRELDIAVPTIKSIFHDYVNELKGKRDIVAPEVLGMDENYLNGKYRAIYTDIINGRIIDMTADRHRQSVERWLCDLPEKERIKCVTIDMWGQYKDAVKTVMPDVPIIIDKFHVIKNCNEALDTIRKEIRENLTDKERRYVKNNRWLLLRNEEDLTTMDHFRLEDLLQSFPVFEKPYRLKEDFKKIYQADSRREAEQLFADWKKNAHGYPEFESFSETVDNWYAEIFNYFDFGYTNATTEALNKLAKRISELGSGYTFEVLRAKMLYGTPAAKPAEYKYITPSDSVAENTVSYMSHIKPLLSKGKYIIEISAGTDIFILLDLLKILH